VIKKVGMDSKVIGRLGNSPSERLSTDAVRTSPKKPSTSTGYSIEKVLVRRLSKINTDFSKISMTKKRDVFVKVSLEKNFGVEFILSTQYEKVHERVLEQMNSSTQIELLDTLIKKLS